MSGSGSMKLQFALEAIDKATATVTKIGRTIDKLAEPAKRVKAVFAGLGKESGLGKVQAAVGALDERFSGVRGKLGQLAGGVTAVTAAAGGAVFVMKSIADQVDAISDKAEGLGMDPQKYQRMGYAAQMAGSNIEELGDAFSFLQNNISQALSGDKNAQKAFARVGVSVRDLRALKPDEIFEKIADKFKAVGDGGVNASRKIETVQAIFGRGGKKLKQVLDLGSDGLKSFYKEADELGVTLGGETLSAMGAFNDMWDKMRLTIFGAVSRGLAAMAPSIQAVMDRIINWTAANRELINSKFIEWADKAVVIVPKVATAAYEVAVAVVEVVSVVDKVAQAMGGWQSVIAVITGVMLGNLLVSLASLTGALWGVAAAFIATPFGMVAAGITLVAGLATMLYKNWDGITSFFSGIWNSILGGFRRIEEAMPDWLRDAFSGGGGSVDINVRDGRGGAVAPPSALGPAGAGKTEVGGTLKITIDGEGRPKVSELSKAPWSPMQLDVGFTGGPLAF